MARQFVRACLDTLEISAVDRTVLVHAEELAGIDFDDNVRNACALTAGLDAIVTGDLAGFAGAPIATLRPGELLARLGIDAPEAP